jgi:hypothetical protein
MKKIPVLMTALVFVLSINLQAQNRTLKKVMELQMPKTVDDDMPGTRGASVCWNPVTKKYYAVFAGNMGYPLGVFDVNGNRSSDADLAAMIDTRGLWYNPATKKISGNGYDHNGWFSYILNEKGIPTDYKTDLEGQHQPDVQSVGVFDPGSKSIMFLLGSQVHFYNMATADSNKAIQIHWGRKKEQGPSDNEDAYASNEDYNYTSIVYTGIKGAQVGVLNITNKEIELYNYSTGYRQQVLSLPDNAVLEASFNFAFANGIYWLFDIPNRKWVGYK